MGVSGKLLLGGLLASVTAASLPGCQEEKPFGYVQIKSEIKLASSDIYTLNGEVLDNLNTTPEVVLKQKAGPALLKLNRQGRIWTLCTISVTHNRVVTATLKPLRGTIKCEVQS
jgi:hypothetical protein